MKFYCEVFSKYALPTIRAMLAMELAERGLTQEMIAEKLDVTQAAVSQYLRNIRGRGAIDIYDENLISDISKFADKIKKGLSKDEFAMECMRIFRNMKEYGLLKEFGELYPSNFFSGIIFSKSMDSPESSETRT